MKKEEYLKKNKIKIRKATKKDKELARTDYQRNANYIITCQNRQFFSTNGSLKDCQEIQKFINKDKKGQTNDKKTAKNNKKICKK